MSKEISKKTKSSLYWNISLKIPYELFRFVSSILVARVLDPHDFGIVSIATMVIYYSNSFSNFGFNQALVQRNDIQNRHINSVFTFDLTISILLGIVVYYSSEPISSYFNSPESNEVIKALSVVFVLTTLHDLPYVLLRRDIEFKILAIVDMFREVLMAVITLILAYNGFKYWSIVIGHLIPLLLTSIYLLIKVKQPLRLTYDIVSLKELFGFSLWSFVQMQVYFISNRVDRVLIGKFINTTMLGLYEKSKSLSQMPSESLGDKINSVLFSSFSRLQNDKQGITNIFKKGLVINSLITFPIYCGMYSVSDQFVLVLLGEQWKDMILTFEIMAVAGLFASLNGLIASLTVGSGNYKNYIVRFTISMFVLLIGGILFVEHGIEAVAVVFVIYTIFLFFIGFNLVKTIIPVGWNTLLRCIGPALISSILMIVLVNSIEYYYLNELSMLNLLLLVIIGGVFYSLLVTILPSISLDIIRKPLFRDIKKLYSKIYNNN